jgi:FkbH-like protein
VVVWGGKPPRTPRDHQKRWLQHLKARGPGAVADAVIGVAASFTAEPLEAQLGAALLDAGMVEPAIRFADYNQLHQVCLDPSAMLGDHLDFIVLLWRVEDVFERQLALYIAGDDAAATTIRDGVAELASLVVQLETTSAATVIAATPPHPGGWGIDLADVVTSVRVGRLHREVVSVWLDTLSTTPFIEIVDLDALQRLAGESRIFDAQKWAMYRQPYRSDFWLVVGTEISEAVSRRTTPPPKCIVLDGDNTLWGGIVGEDGIGGLELGDTFPGRAFQAFQRELKVLRARGVMLAVVSKNDEIEVVDVFERHEGMVLTLADIAARRINWQPKSESIAAIAAELNIGIDSLVFVDDNPFELAECSAALPGLRGLLVPEELAELPTLLAESGLFRRMRISAEDLHRSEMMRSEAERTRGLNTMDRAEFLASLDLRVTFLRVSDEHIARVAQLTNKTNQFNLTTIRRDEKGIRDLVASDHNEVYAIRVTDRFGDYGLVGVAITDAHGDEAEGESETIDTLLMSCRVLGRGVESAFLSAIAEAAAARGAHRLVGRYRPTTKNSQVADFYPNHGFEPVTGNTGVFELDLDRHRPENPRHIELTR